MVLTDWYYPGYKAGGPIQSCRNLVVGLKENLDFYVFTSDRDLGEKSSYPNILPDQWNYVSNGERVFYLSPKENMYKMFFSQVDMVKPDIIYLNSMFSLNYTIIPLGLLFIGKIKARVILAPRGMLHAGALKYKSWKKSIFIKLLNLVRIPAQITFHATDEQEAMDLKKHFPFAQSIFLVPNFPNSITPLRSLVKKESGSLSLIFISRISPKKNLLFALRVLANSNYSGEIFLTIAGEIEDQEYWKLCLDQVNSFSSNIKFNYVGPIENDKILDWLQQFHFLILPTFGENFGHAIFEAFIAGKPVIISDKTPWRNLEVAKLGWDLSLENEEGFVSAIRRALEMDQEEYNILSKSAAEFADEYRNNNTTRELYLQLFS